MIKNKIEKSVTDRKRDEAEKIISDLRRKPRLGIDDRRIFAINLGKMVDSLDFDSPFKATKEVFEIAELHDGYQKRKRFICFVNEHDKITLDTKFTSTPGKFIALAEAIAQLRCISTKPEELEKAKKRAYRELLENSSFAPRYVPANASDVSAYELLKEYAQALEQAVSERTKITDLWRLLEDTPIDVTTVEEDELVNFEPVEFVPDDLKNRLFYSYVKSAVFETSSIYDPADAREGWAKPTLKIGHLKFSTNVKVFILPEELRHKIGQLYSNYSEKKEQCVVNWFHEKHISFSNDEFGIEYNYSEHGFGWCEVKCQVFYDLELGFVPNVLNEPELVLTAKVRKHAQIYDAESIYYINFDLIKGVNTRFYEVTSEAEASSFCMPQARYFALAEPTNQETGEINFEDEIYMEYSFFDLIFDHCDDPSSREQAPNPVGILPRRWLDWLEVYSHIIGCDEVISLTDLETMQGWVVDQLAGKTLLGDNAFEFIPEVKDAPATAGIFKQGSIGASLMNNARDGKEGERITDLLIENANIICDAGLKYYDYLHENYHAAIQKI